jgi:uncharacterized membrane protein
MRGHRDLELACVAAVVCAVLGLVIPVPVLSLVFVLPLALFLPGYALAAAALPRWQPGAPQRLVVAVGLSLATLALGSLVLNYLGGLRALPWAIFAVVVVLGGCRYAAIVRPPTALRPRHLQLPRVAIVPALAIVLGLVAAGGAMALAFHPVAANHAVGYTELWLKTGAAPGRVAVGVGNQEHEATRYGVIVRFSGGAEEQVKRLDLAPGQKAVVTVPVVGKKRPGPVRVVATLYREQEPNKPYRVVSGRVPARPVGGGR